MKTVRLRVLALLYVLCLLHFVNGQQAASFSALLKVGQAAASRGDYAAAAEAYTKAIHLENDQYSVFYRRATVYILWHKQSLAIHDLAKTLKLKPGWGPAAVQLAGLYIKAGELQKARDAISNVAHETLAGDKEKTQLRELSQAVDRGLALQSECDAFRQAQAWSRVYEILTKLLEESPQSVQWRLQRAQAAENLGQFDFAIADLKWATALDPANAASFLMLSNMHLKLGEVEQALETVRDCLKSDPDRKECKLHYRRVKSFAKQYRSIQESAEKRLWVSVLKSIAGTPSEPGLLTDAEELCGKDNALIAQLFKYQCYGSGTLKRWAQTIEKCSLVLEKNENDEEALLLRGEAYLEQEDPENANADFAKVLQQNQGNHRAMEGRQKAEALIRRRSMKDYYKVLGLPKDASDRDIKRAYRRAAQQWHPDKYSGDLSKEQVEAKMAEVNQAYQVLSNSELKAKFDAGQDPFSQEQTHAHNPFGGFGNPFGGGGGHRFFFQQGGDQGHQFFTNMFRGGN